MVPFTSTSILHVVQHFQVDIYEVYKLARTKRNRDTVDTFQLFERRKQFN